MLFIVKGIVEPISPKSKGFGDVVPKREIKRIIIPIYDNFMFPNLL